ncbi:crotonyl-CoA carboxylase/reductase [Streptomyces alkaliterrae]|uniref:Crotonyl-CoA carboxylase/reductase n=1 Tax=Streptomyces alkaliterrae TaxID=2213162 RepID=A0A5P0YMW8_9ACTN|nr:crotonyl-CoA carboxylase/reductase [Streptomyces alkaliterrae]MBB1259072.1 crotonyl-CoA carboxylase/reductase [Streptomyces alkaliterrae]MQS00762.1 crotonyl-CoA carboxylase/reductase [Streptomyces alkaliterrae]
MREIVDAVLSGEATAADYAALPLPDGYRGVVVRKEDTEMFDGIPSHEKDPRKSLSLEEVPLPPLGPGEALVAVMASSVNYNSVWSSIFEPLPTFGFLERYGRLSPLAKRHDLPYHVIGSDLSGVVLRTGDGVNRWQPGDEVVAHCLSVELESSDGHNDTMLDPEQRIWGFETNFGGLAEIALVKANQLMPKPGHLTWEEAAAPGLVNSTAYRQLVSPNGARMKQGDNILIWGASGGLGGYATQLALAGGATPICVVSSPRKAEICRKMGAEAIIDRAAEDYRFWKDERTQDPGEWKRFGRRIRELTGGEDVDIVFEHPGRETFGASVYVTRKGGAIVTCASTSGYRHEYDNRHLWMSLKRVIGSHFANYREAWEANRLVAKGRIHPTLSTVYRLEDTGQAAYDVHRNLHQGKVGVLALAPEEGLGVRDHQTRARHVEAINRFRT